MTKILKFGGSSIATPERMEQVRDIILEHAKHDQLIIVVSALRGITDQLLECAMLAADNQGGYKKKFEMIVERHRNAIDKVLESDPKQLKMTHDAVNKIFQQLDTDLTSVLHLRDNHPMIRDLIASFGEQLSATIFANCLNLKRPARFVDASQFIVTTADFTRAKVLYEISSDAIQAYFDDFFKKEDPTTIPIVTGFTGITQDKHRTTLGRDGSNYTASVLACALDAKELIIWSDVDGVYSTDPKLIPTSKLIENVSYSEAKEMSNFETKVVVSLIIPELLKKNILIRVKNTFKPAADGTKITSETNHSGIIKNISIKHKLSLVTLSALSLSHLKIPNMIERLYHALSSLEIDFTPVTHTMGAQDVCFVIKTTDLQKIEEAIYREFLYEFQQNAIKMHVSSDKSAISLIGNKVKEALALLGNIYIELEKNHITLNGIAHGTSDCNVSFIVPSAVSLKALKVIHHTIFENAIENATSD